MAVRFYLIPVETVGSAKGPKYLKWRGGTGTITDPWAWMDNGLQPISLVAVEVTDPNHTFLAAQADVTTVPANIDATVTAGALNATKAALEALWIPGNWVTTSNTWREIMRVVCGLFQFAQRHQGLHGEALMQGTPNLSLTLGDLSAARRNRIQETANSFGYDTTSFTLATTLRVVCKFLADAWVGQPFQFGNIATL